MRGGKRCDSPEKLLRQVFDGVERSFSSGDGWEESASDGAAEVGFVGGVGTDSGRGSGPAQDPVRKLLEGERRVAAVEKLHNPRHSS